MVDSIVARRVQENLRVYPLAKRWSKVFRPRLPEVQDTLRRAIRTIREDFDPSIHIPRQAGRCLDCSWPRSDKGVRAFHMYGHCHVISVVVLDLCQRAMPRCDWMLFSGEYHSVVCSEDGLLVDINSSDDEIEERVITQARQDCFGFLLGVYDDVDEYIEELKESSHVEPSLMPLWSWPSRKGRS